MGRPRKKDAGDTRKRILKAAEAAFGARGFVRARLEDIATEAGITRPSLLYHFRSKELLYGAVVEGVTGELRQIVLETLSAPSASSERLETLLDVMLRFAEGRRGAVAMFVRELVDGAPGDGENLRAFLPVVDLIVAHIESASPRALPEGLPIRAAVLHLVMAHALRIAAAERGDELWGTDIEPRAFVRALLAMGASYETS